MLICRCRPLMELWAICEVVADYKHLIQLLHLQLLGCLGDLALPLDDAPQRCLVPLVVVGLFPLGINPQVLLYVLFSKTPRYCSRIMLISATVLPDLLGPRKIPVHGTRGTTGSERCLLLDSAVGNSLIFPISFTLLPKFDAGKPAVRPG